MRPGSIESKRPAGPLLWAKHSLSLYTLYARAFVNASRTCEFAISLAQWINQPEWWGTRSYIPMAEDRTRFLVDPHADSLQRNLRHIMYNIDVLSLIMNSEMLLKIIGYVVIQYTVSNGGLAN